MEIGDIGAVFADYTSKMYSDDEISGKEQNWQR